MENLATILGLATSVLGLGRDAAQFIKNKLANEIVVTPNSVITTSRHWDSTNSVIVQNTTNNPLFSIQIVFWYAPEQKLKFTFEKVKKEAMVRDLIINYGVVVFNGKVKDENVSIVELLRLMPNESIEIDLQIEKQGEVKIFPASYDKDRSKQVGIRENNFSYPFTVPFSMEMHGMSLLLRKAT